MAARKRLTRNQKRTLRKELKKLDTSFEIVRYYKTKQGEKVVLRDGKTTVISSAKKLYAEATRETKLRRKEDRLIKKGHLSTIAWAEALKSDRKAAFRTIVREHTQSDKMGRKEKQLRDDYIKLETTTTLKHTSGAYYKGRTTLKYTRDLEDYHRQQEGRLGRIENKLRTTYNERMLRYEAFKEALNKGLLKTSKDNIKYMNDIKEGNITEALLEAMDNFLIEEYEIYEGEFYGWQQGNYEDVIGSSKTEEYKARYIEFLQEREEYLEPYIQDAEDEIENNNRNLADRLKARLEEDEEDDE